MKKMTAIQELISSISKNGIININQTLIDRCLQLEKEQIEMAFAKSYLIGLAEVNYDEVNKASEQYYSETYGK